MGYDLVILSTLLVLPLTTYFHLLPWPSQRVVHLDLRVGVDRDDDTDFVIAVMRELFYR